MDETLLSSDPIPLIEVHISLRPASINHAYSYIEIGDATKDNTNDVSSRKSQPHALTDYSLNEYPGKLGNHHYILT